MYSHQLRTTRNNKVTILRELRKSLMKFNCYDKVDLINCHKSAKQPPTVIVKVLLKEDQKENLDMICREFTKSLCKTVAELMSGITEQWYIQEFISVEISKKRKTIEFIEIFITMEGTYTINSVKLP